MAVVSPDAAAAGMPRPPEASAPRPPTPREAAGPGGPDAKTRGWAQRLRDRLGGRSGSAESGLRDLAASAAVGNQSGEAVVSPAAVSGVGEAPAEPAAVSVEATPQQDATAGQIDRTFDAMGRGIREGAQNKVNEYVDRAVGGEDVESMLAGMDPQAAAEVRAAIDARRGQAVPAAESAAAAPVGPPEPAASGDETVGQPQAGRPIAEAAEPAIDPQSAQNAYNEITGERWNIPVTETTTYDDLRSQLEARGWDFSNPDTQNWVRGALQHAAQRTEAPAGAATGPSPSAEGGHAEPAVDRGNQGEQSQQEVEAMRQLRERAEQAEQRVTQLEQQVEGLRGEIGELKQLLRSTMEQMQKGFELTAQAIKNRDKREELLSILMGTIMATIQENMGLLNPTEGQQQPGQ